MEIINILCYCLVSYGIANLFIYSNGPFHIFEHWRNFTNKLHPQIGELFTCMICLSTWIGLTLSLINILVLPSIQFTPFNIILGESDLKLFIVLMDMGFTSGCVWLIHQFEEMMERIGITSEGIIDNGE